MKQVWFAGAHSNIGGGMFPYDCDLNPALSHITLRWMLREAVEAGLRLETLHVLESPIYRPFLDEAIAAEANRDDKDLEAFISRCQKRTPGTDRQIAALVYLGARKSPLAQADALSARGDMLSFRIQDRPAEQKKERGIRGRLGDWWSRQMQRLTTAGWWILEIVPRPQVFWDVEGKARRRTFRSVFVFFSERRMSPPYATDTDRVYVLENAEQVQLWPRPRFAAISAIPLFGGGPTRRFRFDPSRARRRQQRERP